MTSIEKIELLKNTIEKLYCKEGRSAVYIAETLEVNRKNLGLKIKEWNFIKADVRHMTASTRKFINKNENLIVSRLSNNISIAEIARELSVDVKMIKTASIHSSKINSAIKSYLERMNSNALKHKSEMIENSSRNYITLDETLQWKEIIGYPNYYVSDGGTIVKYTKRYKEYYEISQEKNKNNGRNYVSLYNDKKRKNLAVARIVAHAFCDGYSEINNTVNHKDGNVNNNNAYNLEWVSQSENNKHAYRELKRSIVNFKRYNFSKIIYKDKYEFKTITAFAKFIGKSETQTRRYLDELSKHPDIKLIK